MISYTTFNGGTLVKTLTVEDGKLVKQPASRTITSAVRCSASSLQEVMDALDGMTSSQAAGWGIHKAKEDLVFVATSENKSNGFAPADAVARTKEYFVWPNTAGALCLDIDDAHTPEQAYADICAAAKVMFGADVMRDVEMFYRPSTSAGCYIETDGITEQAHGARIYLAVAKAKDIKTIGKAIFDGLFLIGKGRVDASKSGQALYRTLIDDSVWSPERVDYVAPAIRGPGVGYEPPERHRWGQAGKVLELTDEQINGLALKISKVKNTRTNLLLDARAHLLFTRKKWVADHLTSERDMLKKQGISEEEVDKRLKSFEEALDNASSTAVLTPRFTLFLDKDCSEEVSIAEIMREPSKYHARRCCDPLEPEGTFGKAVIYTNGRIAVKSFLHGGAMYRCVRAARLAVSPFESGDLADKVARISIALDQAFPSQVFIHDRRPVRISSDGRIDYLTKANLPLFADKGVQFHENKRDSDGTYYEVRSSLSMKDAGEFIEACSDPLAYEVVQASLRQVVNRPMWIPESGSIVITPGYDPETELFFHFDEEFPPLPVVESEHDAEQLAATLTAPYQDFPVSSPDGKANYWQAVSLTMMLSASIRTTVVTPGFMIDAGGPGVGKTEETRCVVAGTGKRMTATNWSKSEDEARKILVAWVLSSSDYMAIDNFDAVLKSPDLEAILDKPIEEVGELRILGGNTSVYPRNDFLLLVNGINLRAGGGAIARRCIQVLLESGDGDAAWATREFKFPGNPSEYILANWRARHMMCLALVKWSVEQGRSTAAAFNAYPGFDKCVRQVVHRIYGVDVLDMIREEVDAVIEANGADSPKGRVLYLAHQLAGNREDHAFTATELKTLINTKYSGNAGVLNAVVGNLRQVASIKGTINGMRIQKHGEKDRLNVQKWQIIGKPEVIPSITETFVLKCV